MPFDKERDGLSETCHHIETSFLWGEIPSSIDSFQLSEEDEDLLNFI